MRVSGARGREARLRPPRLRRQARLRPGARALPCARPRAYSIRGQAACCEQASQTRIDCDPFGVLQTLTNVVSNGVCGGTPPMRATRGRPGKETKWVLE